MRRSMSGWFFTITGLLACPCHLVITLPLAIALLSGTALGSWMATHEGAITIGAGLYFVGALAVGITLLLVRSGARTSGSVRAPRARSSQPGCWDGSCCSPMKPAVEPTRDGTSGNSIALAGTRQRDLAHPTQHQERSSDTRSPRQAD